MGSSLDRYSLVQPQDSTDRYAAIQPPVPGALSYLNEFARNAPQFISQYMQESDNPIAKYIGNKLVRAREITGVSTPDWEAEVRQKILEAKGTQEQAKDIFFHDISHMFDKFGSVLDDNDLSMIDRIKQVGSAIPQMVTDLPKMAISPIEAGIGIGISEQGQPVYTPEQRAEKIKDAAGIMLSTVVGMGARSAIEGLYGLQATRAVKVVEAGLAPPKLIGSVGRKLITGTTEGALAGATYGAVGRANEADQLSAVMMGLSFAPIGAAFELLHKSKLDVKMKAADELFMTRQIQFTPDTPLAKQAKLFEEIAHTDNMVLAIANANKDFANEHFILQGVDGDYTTVEKINRTLGKDFIKLVHWRGDGKVDMLVRGKDKTIPFNDELIFYQTGFLPNELVSYEGKNYLFTSATSNSEMGHLWNPTTQSTKTVKLSEVRRHTGLVLGDVEEAMQTGNSLKGAWIKSAKAGNPEVFTDTNYAAVNKAKTGEPFKVIGFRQQRSIHGNELSLDAGRFYGVTPTESSGYNPVSFKGFTPEQKAQGQLGYIWKPSGGGYSQLGKDVQVGKERYLADNAVHSLLVHNVTFDKPFVFDGKHKGVWEAIKASLETSKSKFNAFDNLLYDSTDYAEYVPKYIELAKQKGMYPYAPTIEDWTEGKAQLQALIDTDSNYNHPITNLFTEQEKKAFSKYGEMVYNFNTAGKTHPETGYQGMDRILKKVLTREGYDGLIYRNKTNPANTEIVSYKLDEFYKKHPYEVKGVKGNVLDAEGFVDKMYNIFKKDLLQDGNVTPYDDFFHGFATQKGFTEAEMSALKLSFEKRLAKDVQAMIPENEKSVLNSVQKEIENVKLDAADKLRVGVHSNGMYFDTGDSGVIKIRDRETDRLLHSSQSIEEATDFVNQSGQMDTVNLDGNHTVPPTTVFGNVPPAGGSSPIHEGVIPDLPTKAENFISNAEPTWLTRNRENFRNLDVIHNLKGAMLRIQDSLDSARRMKLAAEHPYLSRLQTIHHMLEGSADMDKKIPVWMQLRTSEERIATGARGGKPMNQLEISLAQTLAHPDVDIDKLYKVIEYRRKLKTDGLNGKQLSAAERKPLYDAYKQKLGFNAREETALQSLLMARRLPLDQLETGASVRLAETLQSEAKGFITDRNEYAKKHFTPKQLAAAKLAEKLYADLADRFGVSKDTLLQGYFPHARTKFDGNLSRTLNEFKLPLKEKEFFSRMVRTGEIRAYDDGLTGATQRYISAGFNELHMKKTVNDAIESFKNEVLPQIKDSAQRKNAIAIFNSYKDSVMGKPHHLDKVANQSFSRMLNAIGIKVEPDSTALQNLVSGAMMTITSATQGLRPALALRDLYTGLRSYGIKMLSISKAAEAFNYGFNMKDSAVREALMSSGETAPYGILQFGGIETESAIRNMTSRLGRQLSDAETAMVKWGGQPTVYERLAAGFTIERKKATMEAARKYLAKSQTKEALQEVYKDLRLDSYDHSVQINFDKLFQEGKYDDASKFLARQTVAETLGWYGQGNHPKGWNTYLGRVAGQFGNWSINYRDGILRSAAAGPIKDRVARLAIMASFDGALTLGAAKMGLSFYNWMTLPAMTFMGGPSLDYVQAVNNSIFGFGQDKEVAQSKLKRLLPYDSDNDEWHLNQFWLPGGYFANDIAKAMEVSDDMGTSWGVLRGAGFRVEDAYYKPGVVENYMKENVVEPINY